MYRVLFFIGMIFLEIVLMGWFSFSSIEQWWFYQNFMSNFELIRTFLSVSILLLIAIFLVFGVLEKKYSLKIERLSFGGLNILFNNSDLLYKKSVCNYLDTKRSVFQIDPHFDSFEEVFNSFYDVYNFIRVEMRVLDVKRKKDLELYSISNDILRNLNKILTKHQNNYRRWHKYVSGNDKVLTENKDSNGDNIYLSYHLTPIGIIQSHYYHFSQLMNDFEAINKFFRDEISVKFDIDIKKWEE